MPTRRSIMRGGLGGVLWACGGIGISALASLPTPRRFVLIILRGGMDGLAAVAPYGDPHYAVARGALAHSPPNTSGGLLDLDGFFGLHPALSPLLDLWRREELIVVPAVAVPLHTRSHFDAQDILESGLDRTAGISDGWLNRALKSAPDHGRRLGLAVGYAVPLVLRGEIPVGSWAPARLPEPSVTLLDRIAVLYDRDPILHAALSEGRATGAMAKTALRGMDAGAGIGRQFGALAAAAGRLLQSPDGARVAVMEMGGWDTHVGQTGRLPKLFSVLAEGIAGLKEALGPVWSDTVVLAVSEFGRTVRVNGSGGTDHGTGGTALLAGGALAGKQIVGAWPGLSPDRLFEGRDLLPMTDVRSVFKAVLQEHLGIDVATLGRSVFPGTETLRGLGRRLTRA